MPRGARPGRILASSASLAALVSTFWALKIGLPGLDDGRVYWGALPPTLRDDPVADMYGFDEPLWVKLRGSVAEGDRYVIIAEGDGQHEIRNYAAYSLLPAIQVSNSADANVVVYYGVTAPDTGCVVIGKGVCVARVGT